MVIILILDLPYLDKVDTVRILCDNSIASWSKSKLFVITLLMHSVQNSNNFLAYFNQIDKYLSYILWLKKYVPYHERVTIIASGQTPITRFVKSFEDKLRYFGDLRNQLVHGFRLENKHYLVVSDHALDQIQTIHDNLTKPQTLADLSIDRVDIIIAQEMDRVDTTLQTMSDAHLKYMPVYADDTLIWVLSFQDIMHRLIANQEVDATTATLSDVDVTHYTEYAYIAADTSVYQIQDVFEQDTTIEVLLVTIDGTATAPITDMISVYDLPWLYAKL